VTIEQLEPPRVYNPGRTAAWLSKQIELGLADVDLSLSQYRILGLLAEGSAMSSSLAERLAVRPPSVTAVIDGLVARGFVARTHSEDDRRRVSLELTDEGRSVLQSADDAVNERLRQIAECLPTAKASAKAINNLALWHDALVAHRAARSVAK
jgi:DNA-binding MarR family transcriptional regulator